MLPAMPHWSTIVAGFAPSLFWLWLVHRRDDNEREPILLVLAAMGLGSGSAMLVLWLRPWLETTCGLDRAVDAFLVTALAEEIAKTIFVLPILWMREVDEPLDGIVYGVAAALGFAGVENTLWADTSHELGVVLQRASTSTLLHAGCTGSIGFAIVCSKLCAFGSAPRARGLAAAVAALCGIAARRLRLVPDRRCAAGAARADGRVAAHAGAALGQDELGSLAVRELSPTEALSPAPGTTRGRRARAPLVSRGVARPA
jgi:hypothetical protein